MSRASDLRDELITEIGLQDGITAPVDAFVVPDYTREELAGQCRIGVRFADREVDSVEDMRTVTIEIGVFGLIDVPADDVDDPTPAQVRAAQIAAADACDAVMESIIELWVPRGPFFRLGFADHRFHMLRQINGYDAKQLHENGVWASVIQVDFKDIEDD